jgi:Fe-S oxidoreductase
MLEIWTFRIVFLVSVGVFVAEMVKRVRLVWRAPGRFSVGEAGARLWRTLIQVGAQSKVIRERPFVGVMHAFVFWGFVAFSGFSAVQFLKGLGLADLTGDRWFHLYSLAVVPFAATVLVGILALLVRRVVLRPAGLGATVSVESVIIGLFIATLMVTFFLDLRLTAGTAARVNWWVHALVILVFLVLIPNSKHLHLLVSPMTVFLAAPALGTVRNLDFEKEEVGYEAVKDLERKQVLDAFTCVECGRCQDQCPAHGTGKALNPKSLVLQNEEALLAGGHDRLLVKLYEAGVLWQCTTCGACESQCPVGVEHLPLIIGARRGLVSNGDAPEYLASVYNNLERRGNIWGFTSEQRDKFIAASGFEIFDPARHKHLLWLGCTGSFDADFQKALRSLGQILQSRGVTFGVLAKERCTGDPAKRTGNEYLFQELATANVEDFRRAGVRRILTACPHCLKAIGDDYRAFGFDGEITHAASLLAGLAEGIPAGDAEVVTIHDSCYLARYAGETEAPRELLRRAGATLREPARRRGRTFCCGAGGGLLFEEHEEGTRISQARFEQLQATGAPTIITSCPFCAVMLKGAQASANAETRVVDLMSFLAGRLTSPPAPASPPAASAGST